jgi:protein-disulfide isomerase
VRSPALHLIVVLGLLAGGARARAEDHPIVAVFNIEAKRLPLKAELVRSLSDYLAAQLAASGAFSVVPRDRLKSQLVKQKKASYKDCYSQTCQIEIGQELAAQKALSTQILKLAGKCVVTSTLFDLKRAATDRAATSEGGCAEAALMESVRGVTRKLAGSDAAPVVKPDPGGSDPGGPEPAVDPSLVRGAATASVTIEDFVDYQAPYSKTLHPVVLALLRKLPGKVRYLHRDAPFDSECNPYLRRKGSTEHAGHALACRAAYYARCAASQGKFAAMDDALFAQTRIAGEEQLRELARKVGLDLARLGACLSSPRTRQTVLADLTASKGSTPVALVNGEKVEAGRDLAWWEKKVRSLLGARQ